MKNPRILFLCTDDKKPVGGIKQIYKMVELLNKNNFDSYVLHKKNGYRVTWFENNAKILYNREVFSELKYCDIKDRKIVKLKLFFYKILDKFKKNCKISSDDILVFPEIYGNWINNVFPNNFKVIFNQNCFYTFQNTQLGDKSPYLNKNNLATITVSENSKQYLETSFEDILIERIRLSVNNVLFNLNLKKKKQICYMPRKLNEDIIQILSMLSLRGKLKNWEFIPIDNKSEEEVSVIMKESFIFLCLNYTEGFGLPPVEAMACGCIVVGYTGQAGKEYFKPEFSFPIEERNIIEFVNTIEKVALDIEVNENLYLRKSQNASNHVLENYSYVNEKNDTLRTWNKIIELYKNKI